jgi:hypothetical protein
MGKVRDSPAEKSGCDSTDPEMMRNINKYLLKKNMWVFEKLQHTIHSEEKKTWKEEENRILQRHVRSAVAFIKNFIFQEKVSKIKNDWLSIVDFKKTTDISMSDRSEYHAEHVNRAHRK